MSTNSIKGLIENELSILKGERIRQLRQGALMLGVDFGEDVEYTYATGPKRGEISVKPRYALHIHTSWRLLKDEDICLSQSAMFTNVNGFRWCEDTKEGMERLLFAEVSKKLNEIFEAETIYVLKIEANEQGDLIICMENDYRLEVFVDSIGDTESWRFFETNGDKSLVIFDEDNA